MIQESTQKWAPVFLWPMLVAFVIGFVWPFLQGLFLSFTQFKTTSKWTFIGIDNYIKAFQDESFRYSFGYTALYAIVSLILINVLAFAIAYALTQKIRGANLFRTVFFMPNLIGGIVLGYIWSMIFDGVLGAYGESILTNSTWGFWTLCAEALLAASAIRRSSKRLSVGGKVDCTMNTVAPLTLSLNDGWNSPSLNVSTSDVPSSRLSALATFTAKSFEALQAKSFILCSLCIVLRI